MKQGLKPPLLRGFLSADGKTIRVWCPFCECMHQHGWPEGRKKTKRENRVEHCHSQRSPFRVQETGYDIAPWRPCDLRTSAP